MDLGLDKAVAFVAGASGGLGWATARALAEEGADVAICSRDAARINAAADRIRQAVPSASVLPLVCDVRDEVQIQRVLEETVAHFGALHILITNAGGPPAGLIDDIEASDFRNAVELNLISTVNLCRHALPHLRKAAALRFARVLMITSVSAKQPIPNLMLSNTARAGVQGFARSLAEELGPAGITVNTILPGYTETERLDELKLAIQSKSGQSADAVEADWAAQNALKRLGQPDEFAAAAAFLVSERAAYITGVALPVDGGRSKGLL